MEKKPNAIQRILQIEPGISLAQWAYDLVTNHWSRIVTLFVAGGGMTYLSTITEWTRALGAAGIGLLVFATVLLANLLLSQAQAMRAKARERNALATASTSWIANSDAVNPLDAHFQKKRISVQDLAHPLGKHVADKKFSECQLVGPANIAFVENCNLIGIRFGNCDMILTKDVTNIFNVIPFHNCSILGGEILNATIFVHPNMLSEIKKTPGLYFVNLTGDPELDSQSFGAE